MAISYYDDAITYKLKNWIPDNSKLRVLKPDETKRLIEMRADDNKDKPLQLPLIAISRKPDIEIGSTIKQARSFDGLRLVSHGIPNPTREKLPPLNDVTALLNVIPIKAEYQLDIYTKKQYEGEEYVRNFLFKLINNPLLVIEIPYNNMDVRHTANLRVLSGVSDTSAISERLFPGQFTRWTIQLELQDGFLFSVPYKQNWSFIEPALELAEKISDPEELVIKEEISQVDIVSNDNITETESTINNLLN